MTQDNFLVSPADSACLKRGTPHPLLRPADKVGDMAPDRASLAIPRCSVRSGLRTFTALPTNQKESRRIRERKPTVAPFANFLVLSRFFSFFLVFSGPPPPLYGWLRLRRTDLRPNRTDASCLQTYLLYRQSKKNCGTFWGSRKEQSAVANPRLKCLSQHFIDVST
jgi:hypothetical protein